jgi:ATP-binding cassette, subfamily B, bacterial PglK
MLASGGAELVSLGAVLPFLAVLSGPEQLWLQPLVQALAARVGFTQASELLLPVAVGSDLSWLC